MGTDIAEIINEARSMGADFRLTDGGVVLVRGLSRLPEDLRDTIRGSKAQLVMFLSAEHGAPVIWQTNNVGQIRSLLVLREAELILTKSHLTGKTHVDWYICNNIAGLEIQIANLTRWLEEAALSD